MVRKTTSRKPGLQFNMAIISSVKDPISTKDLLLRLQLLHNELASTNQDDIDIESFAKIEKDLINKKLLRHANVGVQAFTCCCLSDILRIHAPDAPYTEVELVEMFKAFFRQFNKLADDENPYFPQQEYLLKRVVEVRSIILITDLPESELLIETIFDNFYQLATKNFPTKLQPLVCDMLSEIITETETIPHNVLKLILDKFLSSNSVLINNANISNPALNFSLHICENNIDRMQRMIAQYFSESFYDLAKEITINNDNNDLIITNKMKNSIDNALQNLKKNHKLAVQIWKYIPELLNSVISLIEDELNADDEKIRILATETIGQIIGSPNIVSSIMITKVNFFIIHRDCWISWLKKTTDISPSVRMKWVEQYPSIIKIANTSTSEVSNQLNKCLYKCLIDSNDNVRSMACKVFEDIPFEIFTNRVCNLEILKALSHCIREKNAIIRNQAIKTLGFIYNNYQKAKESGNVIDFGIHDEEQSSIFAEKISCGIPNDILNLYYINDKLVNAVVDTTMYEALLPISETTTTKRVNRLLEFYGSLKEKAKDSFLAMNKRQIQNAKVVQTFVKTIEEIISLGNTIDNKENMLEDKSEERQLAMAKLDKIMKWLSDSFPEDWNTYAYVERFAKLKNSRFLYLLNTSVSLDSDYNTVRNSIKELLKKLNDSKSIYLENDHTVLNIGSMVANFKLLLIRSSYLVFNKSNIIDLINYSKDTDHEWNDAANDLLEVISEAIPDIFKVHFKELVNLLISENDANETKQRSYTLRTIYHFIKKFPDMFPSNEKLIDGLKSIAVRGSPREAKYAIKILGHSELKDSSCNHIFKQIYPLDLTNSQFPTHLSVIGELLLVDPFIIQDEISALTELLIKEVFLKNRDIEESIKHSSDWIDDKTMDQQYKLYTTLYEKLLALRILINRLKSLEKASEGNIEEMKSSAQPVFKLLVSLIGNGGEIVKQSSLSWPTPEVYKLRIRLAAGEYLLKIAKIGAYSEMIHPTTIRRLTFLLTDSNENVRRKFLDNLNSKLVQNSISERFIPVIFYSALESSPLIKRDAKMWINTLFKRQDTSTLTFEKSIVRLVHILTHDDYILNLTGEFDINDKQIVKNYVQAYTYAARIFVFYLNLISNSNNISLLYYLVSRVKQHRDAVLDAEKYDNEPTSKEVLNLYRLSELAQLVIRDYSESKSWTLQTWIGKIKLPIDIYAPMTSLSEVQQVITTVYIPEIIQQELKGPIKKRIQGSETKKVSTSRKTSSIKKRKSVHDAREKSLKKKTKVVQNTEPSRKSLRLKSNVRYDEEHSESNNESESDYSG